MTEEIKLSRLDFLEQQYPKLKRRIHNLRKQYRELQNIYIATKAGAHVAWQSKNQIEKNWRELWTENTNLKKELNDERKLTRQAQASGYKVLFYFTFGVTVGIIVDIISEFIMRK